MNNTNNVSARQSFEQARKMFFIAFRDKFPIGPGGDQACMSFVNSLKLAQGEIRLEVELNTTSTRFEFGVTPTQSNSTNFMFPTEKRLPLQDSICIAEHAIYLANPADRNTSNFDLYTYGNRIAFPTGGQNLDQQFYANGGLTVKCNNDVLVPYRGLRNHRVRPQTQQTAAFGVGSPLDQQRMAEDGLITDEPNYVMIGSKNNIPAIELPAALAAVDPFTRAVYVGMGVYAQNSTIVS